ncbi:MAG: TolC family protein [Desulfurivibrionaceae bacterium]
MRQSDKICLALLAAALTFSMIPGQSAASETGERISLEQAFRIALENNEQVKISGKELRQAETDVTTATSELYPQISVRGAYNWEKERDFNGGSSSLQGSQESIFTTPNEYGTLSLQLDQHIYQWGKVWSGRKIAQYYREGTRLRHVRRVQEILFQVSTRYYEVLLGREAIEIAETALERAEKQLQQARARFNAGILTRTDVLRAEVQVSRSREELERAKNQHDIAMENLALELGIGSTPDSLAEPGEKSFPQTQVTDLYNKALKNRKDLKQAQKELQGRKENISVEKADFFPRLSFTGQYTRTDEKGLYYGEYDDWRAALELSFPLFTGWKNSADVDRAKAEQNKAEYSLDRLRKQIRNEVRSVYLNIQTQEKVIDQLKKQVQSAEENYRQVTARFQQGLVTAVDQIDAFTALTESENSLAQAYYTYQLDLIQLKLATGTFQEDLLEEEILNENS